jgi:hypothetical protein
MSTAATAPRPDFGRLYGITYDKGTKVPIVRAPRVLKIGIGIPKGKAIHIFLHGGLWHIRFGVWEDTGGKKKLVMKTVYRGESTVKMGDKEVTLSNKRADVEAWFNANKDRAAISNRPQKIPHFTFTRRTIIEDESGRPIEMFEPDWDAIEAHGDAPRRIPVILTSESPMTQAFEWWTATALQCHGDGLLAERLVAIGSEKDENWKVAKDAGLKMFLYQPCFAGGCKQAGVECKPHSTLNVQLAYAMRLGATAYFTTTGMVSAGQLFSSLMEIKDAIESRGYSIAGIPMDLVLGSFRATHDGKPSVQPCVSLELRSQSNQKLNQILAENSWVPAQLGTSTRQITSAVDDSGGFDAPDAVLAPAIAAEFSEADFDDEAEVVAEAQPPAATATQEKQAAVGEKLAKARKAAEATPAPQSGEPAQAPAAAAPPAPAPVAPVPVPTTTTFPWADDESMRSLFKAEIKKDSDFVQGILKKHGVMFPQLKPDDPRSVAIYNEIKAGKVPAPQGSLIQDEDLF